LSKSETTPGISRYLMCSIRESL